MTDADDRQKKHENFAAVYGAGHLAVQRATQPDPDDEIEALRALLRKTRNSVGWWAALSYVDGVNHDDSTSRWTSAERALLHRAGL
jgi:hypothetical protein